MPYHHRYSTIWGVSEAHHFFDKSYLNVYFRRLTEIVAQHPSSRDSSAGSVAATDRETPLAPARPSPSRVHHPHLLPLVIAVSYPPEPNSPSLSTRLVRSSRTFAVESFLRETKTYTFASQLLTLASWSPHIKTRPPCSRLPLSTTESRRRG